MSIRTLAFGAVLWDVIGNEKFIGGAPFNFASHMARFGCRSSILTRVGCDPNGEEALEAIIKLGVDPTYIRHDEIHPTGLVEVTLTENGIPSYILHEGVAYDFIELTDELLASLKQQRFDLFYFGTFEQRSPVNRESIRTAIRELRPRHVLLDVNFRRHYYNEEIVRESLLDCTILKINEEELEKIGQMLYGGSLEERAFLNRLTADCRIATVCVTKGEHGCTVYHEGAVHDVPGIRVEVADTVGAGDAFSAAFVHKLLTTGDPVASAEDANRFGAYVASIRGAIPADTTVYGML